MKNEFKLIDIDSRSPFQLDPTLNGDEAIVLRALAAGQTDKEVCKQLHMAPTSFLRMMRDIRQKIGTRDNISLVEWAKQRINGVDQRVESFRRSS